MFCCHVASSNPPDASVHFSVSSAVTESAAIMDLGTAGQSRKDKSDRDCLSYQMVRPTSQRWVCFPSRKSRKHGDLRDTARSCVLNTTVHLKHENHS